MKCRCLTLSTWRPLLWFLLMTPPWLPWPSTTVGLSWPQHPPLWVAWDCLLNCQGLNWSGKVRDKNWLRKKGVMGWGTMKGKHPLPLSTAWVGPIVVVDIICCLVSGRGVCSSGEFGLKKLTIVWLWSGGGGLGYWWTKPAHAQWHVLNSWSPRKWSKMSYVFLECLPCTLPPLPPLV